MSVYSKEQLYELKSKIDWFEFYQKFLPELIQRGKLAWSTCPWHSETRPSFSIDTECGIWRCWGSCNIGGDCFKFYQKFYGTTFGEAVQKIAEMYNYELVISEEEIKERNYKKALYNVNETMCNAYEKSLTSNNEAYNYLTEIRRISPKIIKDFRLGCGINKLPDKNSLKKLGLLLQGENGDFYSKFRSDRIVIPRFDEYGNILSFTGRLHVEKEGAKYLHTTDNEIYKKSELVFGLYQAKRYIKEYKSVIICEGELDVIKCHQKGICNSVCLSGLNISEAQINLLKKYTSTFYVCVEDGAILKPNDEGLTSLDKFYNKVKENLQYAKVYIIDLRNKDGSKCDPDMYLNEHTRQEFNQLIKYAKIYNEFVINEKAKNFNPKNIEEKTACINSLIPLLANIKNFMDRKQYIELVANKLLIPENDIYKKCINYNNYQAKALKNNQKYDLRPIYAQKILLSSIFYENFSSNRALALIKLEAYDLMEAKYQQVYEILWEYINHQNSLNATNIDFSKFMNEIQYREDITDSVRETIMDCYLKREQLEELTADDLDDLIDEQVDSLKEFVVTH